MAFDVNYFTLGVPDIASKYVTLDGTPVNPGYVALDIIGGTAQAIRTDFTVSGVPSVGWTVDWAGLNLDTTGPLALGDQLRVIYDRS